MGWGGVSAGQLLIILLIVIMIFGTKRVKTLGSDLGGAIRSFRRAVGGLDSQANGESDHTKRLSIERQ